MAASGNLYSPPGMAPGAFLGRYRRPVYGPLAESYITAHTAPGDLVLDPFCQDATVLRAAISLGRHAVALTGNPLLALLARVEAAPRLPGELEGALRQVRYAPKVDTPLGEHLDRLYATACAGCGERVPAAAFIWERAAAAPAEREYACPRCGHGGREPLPAEEAAAHLAGDAHGFHRRLVAERLRTGEDHQRLQQRLLDLYTPRSLYALTALVLKIELLFADSPLLDALRAALLHTMDVAGKLNLATEEGWTPVHSLQLPRRFREANVWQTFVAAVEGLARAPQPPGLALAGSPAQVLSASRVAGCVAAEPLPRVTAALQGQVALALSQLPRFDPTFAALSYLWAGWLLGKDGSRAAEHLLHQRAPEESRYLRALQSTLGALGGALAPEARLVLTFQAPATRYLETALVAAGTAGLPLVDSWHGVLDDRPTARFGARRAEHHLAFGPRRPQPAPPGDRAVRAQTLAVSAAAAVLGERGEPAPFTALHGPIWDSLSQEGLLGGSRTVAEAEELRQRLAAAVEQGLAESDGPELALWTSGGETGQATWWLAAPRPGTAPLADRTERLVRDILRRGRPLDEPGLAREVTEDLPGPLAPPWPLIRACLESYGRPSPSGEWALGAGEDEASLRAWRERALGVLAELGRRLGYEAAVASEQEPGLAWREGEAAAVGFLLQEDAAWAGPRARPQGQDRRRVLVIPARRLSLWRHKLAAAPQWAAALERAGWTTLAHDFSPGTLADPSERGRLIAALGLAEPGSQASLF